MPRHCKEQQYAYMLARMRCFGPVFDHELIEEGYTQSPAARVAELNADGYHIEALRRYRRLPDGSHGWAMLYVMRVKHYGTGEVIATPVPVGFGYTLERWAP